MAEKLCNRATTLLSAAITDSSVTVINVVGPADFPNGPNFRLRCENELMMVTSGSNTTTNWVVQRGIEGTIATFHGAGAKVYGVLTAGSLAQYIAENGGGGGGGGGSQWRTGSGAPSNGLGVNGDLYLRVETGDVYQRSVGVYGSPVANIKGATGNTGPTGSTGSTGATGAAGAVWRTASGVPSDGTGVDGDFYLNTANGDVYKRVSSHYNSPIANIIGPTGATGAIGPSGATWRSGSGTPSNGTGNDGDFYFKTSTGEVYLRAASSYSSIANLTGPTGPTGATGSDGVVGSIWRTGSGAPSDGTGVNGDFYLRTSNGDYYERLSGTYGSPLGNLTGPTGATGSTGSTGADGTDGATWRTGSGAPSDGTGVNGDLYFRTSNNNVYLRSAGSYSSIADLTGATGATGSTGSTGAAGVDGATWRTGSGVPSDGTGVNGDLYLRTSNGNVYLRSGGSYSIIENLVGPTGSTGSTGATGSAGSGREYTFCLGIQTACQVITDATNHLYINTAATITRCSILAKTAPVGASLIIDILYSADNGSTWTSIWTTTANRLSLATTVTHNTTTTFDNTSLSQGYLLRIDIIQIGSTTPGQDVTVQLAT